MPLINIVKPFRLNLGTIVRKFEAGIHDVEEEVSSHWYTLLHSIPVPDVAPVAQAEAPAPAVEPEEPPAPVPPLDSASVTEEQDGTVHVDSQEEADEKAVLKAQAEALGISVDGRWGVARLKAEIAAKAS